MVIFIFGLISGSLINCLALRLSAGEKIFLARSRCPLCQKVLGALELVPLFSFLLQKARCRGCGKKISWQYPAVELVTGIVFWLFYRFGSVSVNDYLGMIVSWLILSSLILIFLIDWREGVILDITVWPLSVILLIAAFFDGNFLSALAAAAAAAAFFGAQYLFSRGRWIGAGDIGLGFLLGALLGWPRILVALFLAYVGGAMISLVLLALRKKKFAETVPLGAFLAPAAYVTMLWGGEVIRWYWNLLS